MLFLLSIRVLEGENYVLFSEKHPSEKSSLFLVILRVAQKMTGSCFCLDLSQTTDTFSVFCSLIIRLCSSMRLSCQLVKREVYQLFRRHIQTPC